MEQIFAPLKPFKRAEKFVLFLGLRVTLLFQVAFFLVNKRAAFKHAALRINLIDYL